MLYEQDEVNASEPFLYVIKAAALTHRLTSNIIDDVKMALLGNGKI